MNSVLDGLVNKLFDLLPPKYKTLTTGAIGAFALIYNALVQSEVIAHIDAIDKLFPWLVAVAGIGVPVGIVHKVRKGIRAESAVNEAKSR